MSSGDTRSPSEIYSSCWGNKRNTIPVLNPGSKTSADTSKIDGVSETHTNNIDTTSLTNTTTKVKYITNMDPEVSDGEYTPHHTIPYAHYKIDTNCKPDCCTRTTNTAYVDVKYGSCKGELNNPAKSFGNVQQAIDAIVLNNDITSRWVVQLGAGNNGPGVCSIGNISFNGLCGVLSGFGPLDINADSGTIVIENCTLLSGYKVRNQFGAKFDTSLNIQISNVNGVGSLDRPIMIDAYGVSHNLIVQNFITTALNDNGTIFGLGGDGVSIFAVIKGSITTHNDIVTSTETRSIVRKFIDIAGGSGTVVSRDNTQIVNSNITSLTDIVVAEGYNGSVDVINSAFKVNTFGGNTAINLSEVNSSLANVTVSGSSVSSIDQVGVNMTTGSHKAFVSNTKISSSVDTVKTPIVEAYTLIVTDTTDLNNKPNESYLIVPYGYPGNQVSILLPDMDPTKLIRGQTYTVKNNSVDTKVLVVSGSAGIRVGTNPIVVIEPVLLGTPVLNYTFTWDGEIWL